MPQLLPYYLCNQLLWGFIGITLLTVLMSKKVLPKLVYVYLTRIYISKL